MKTKIQTQITVHPPPLSLLVFDNGGGQGGGRMLDLHKQSAVVRSPLDKERVGREIESTDKSIDRLVYELYGLTEDEVKIVES